MLIATQGAVGDLGRKATTFLSLDYKSMAVINGIPIGANETGLHQLNTGLDDNEVLFSSSFTLNTSNYNIDNFKSLRILYAGVVTSDDITVEVKFDNNDWQSLEIIPEKNGLQKIRIFGAHDYQGSYFTLRLTSFGQFKIDYLRGVFIIRPMGIGD